MFWGRVIFGIGCETMYVGQAAIVSQWFINFELPLAMAVVSCVPLLGSLLNGVLVPTTYNVNQSFFEAFGIGFILCLFSLFLVMLMGILDKKMELHDN